MAQIVLVEIGAKTDAAGTSTTLRYASGKGYNDATAPGFYDPRVLQAANFERHMFAAGTTGGKSDGGFGECRIANADHALDGIKAYGYDGQTFRALVGDDGAAYSTFKVLLTGTMVRPEFSRTEIRFRIRDRQYQLDKPIQAVFYAGSNSGSPLSGIEGAAADIKGQEKPLLFGAGFQIPAVCVNTDRLIYQVHDGAGYDVVAAYDNGVALSKGADYSSQADMEANAPSAGQYRVWKAGLCFRVGSTPAGTITCDAQGDASGAGYVSTVADIVKRIAVDKGGIDGADVTAADITALNAANSSVVGIWISGARDVSEVITDLARSVGAWWGFDRLGKLRIKRLTSPAGGTPVATFKLLDMGQGVIADATTGDTVEFDLISGSDPGDGLPVSRVEVDYGENYQSVQIVTGSASVAERSFIGRDFRTESAADPAVLLKHAQAGTLRVETRLTVLADAKTEADRLLALYKTELETVSHKGRLDPALVELLDLGEVVTLQVPRFGWDAGKPFAIIGMTYDVAGVQAGDLLSATTQLTLWG